MRPRSFVVLTGPNVESNVGRSWCGSDQDRPPSGAGEPVRNVGYHSGGQSVWFRNTHRGKKSVVLNLKDKDDLSVFLELCKTADVLPEAFWPGVVERLGIGPDALRALNPHLVYASISAFGQTGLEAHRPAHDLAIEAMAGVVSLNLGQDDQPTNPHMPVADVTGAMTALTGILMALLRREKTGQGDCIHVSMQDATMAWLPNVVGPVFAKNRPPHVKEERSFGGYAFYSIYQTSDRKHVALGGVEVKFVHTFLNALERVDLIPIACGPSGLTQEPFLDFLTEIFKTRTRVEWENWFQDKDICFAPVLDLKETWAQPQVASCEML